MAGPGTPAVSVVTPAYNAESTIAETIASLRAQTLADWEQVVCDDGSTDGTLAAVAAVDDRRIRVVRGDHRGQSAAQNRAFAQCRADLVLFLDADDVLLPDALARLAAALAAAPDACAAYGDAVTMKADGTSYGRPPMAGGRLSARPSGDVLEPLLVRDFVPSGGFLVRAAAFAAAGGFAEDLRMAQDWEMRCRLALRGPFRFIGPGPVLRHRARPDSVSRGLGARVESHLEAIERVFANPAVAARFAPRRLAALRRRRLGSSHAFIGTEAVRQRDYVTARRHLWRALVLGDRRAPVMALALCAALGWVPPLARRQFEV
ncbi:MAG: glycosyltransferase [Hyphomicrobiales bacterium]|nr:glycosyltransferase [Hyphomicrobiales bacterium]MCP5371780.1 glycosyltransferase [Hyphomicrobiales bacterium]